MIKKIIILLTITLLLTSCASTINVTECLPEDPYGFWGGLWHGLIAPMSFIGGLFSDGIAIYSVNNNGGWYDFGYVVGLGTIFTSVVKIILWGFLLLLAIIKAIFS